MSDKIPKAFKCLYHVIFLSERFPMTAIILPDKMNDVSISMHRLSCRYREFAIFPIIRNCAAETLSTLCYNLFVLVSMTEKRQKVDSLNN